MNNIKLKTQILLSFSGIVLFLSICISVYGFFIVKTYIYGEGQSQARRYLKTVHKVYEEKIDVIQFGLDLVDAQDRMDDVKQKLQLDYLVLDDVGNKEEFSSPLAYEALKTGRPQRGTRIISKQELSQFHKNIAIKVLPTPKATETEKKIVDSAMVIEYARPVFDSVGEARHVLYGGKIVTGDEALIDEISDTVFEKKMYRSKPIGTVTIFQDGVRIATNVLDKKGERAIGTRVSDEVYEKVVRHGECWFDRAFVVTDWYITAYEPLKDISGRIIGILYVGILEEPFNVIRRKMFLTLLTIIAIASVPALLISLFLANSITKPLTLLSRQAARIANGDLESKIDHRTFITEINVLTDSFNDMSGKLKERKKTLEDANDKLAVFNKRYLELVGFVSHELKGILSSIVLNTYLLQKKILGDINEQQYSALKSMARNLDYLTVTVKNFLNLSRIEKEELKVEKQKILFKEHILATAVESFAQQMQEKGIECIDEVEPDTALQADPGLMQIVINNLLSNAIKYGLDGGKIRVRSQDKGSEIEIEVYNDGEPVSEIDVDKLFKKFSRVIYRGMENVKGTGIGLFISREIIEKHGGKIWIEPRGRGNSFVMSIPKT